MSAEAARLAYPDLGRLLPAECRFNPSLARWHGRLWMIYRRVDTDASVPLESWPRRLAACELDADFQPVPDTNIDLSAKIVDPPGARRWHADARFFARADGPWLWYHDNHDMFAFRFDPERVPARIAPMPLRLAGRERRERERNWGMFDDGRLKAVYTIDPHVVLEMREGQEGIVGAPAHETKARIPWERGQWGEPHGGSSPVRVGSCWFAFFHSNAPARPGSSQKIYRVGFYGFDAKPPHRIRYMSTQPVIEGSTIPGPLSYWHDYAVAYPSGAVFIDGRWIVALGIHDRAMAFLTVGHEELLAGCARL